MLPVAIVLLVLILVFAIGAVVSNSEAVILDIFVIQIPSNLAVVFILGAATAIALMGSLGLLYAGFRRQRARARETRELRGPVSKPGSKFSLRRKRDGGQVDAGGTKTSGSGTSNSGTSGTATSSAPAAKVKPKSKLDL